MSKDQNLKIGCFGEVLWDVFPTSKKIGGAPLNVAIRLHSFGNDVYMISKVGDDQDGKIILDSLNLNDMNLDYIQIDKQFHTGEVKVILNSKGSASYDIKFPRAWDKIEMTEDLANMVKTSDAFIYGSLVARDDVSKNTLLELLKVAKYKIFDVNLRPPYYTEELLIELIQKADFIKFNDDELYEIAKYLGSKYHSLEQNIKYIAEKTNTENICVTKGRHGAVLLFQRNLYYNSGYQVDVKDTVGAGDSFLASLVHKLLHCVNPQEAIDFACAVGAMVTQNEGATPIIPQFEIDKFINP